MSKKNKKRFWLITMLVVVIVVFCGLWLVGFDNIKAVYYGIRYDKTEIDAMKQSSSERLNKKVAEYGYITAREPTAEENEAVNSGEITEQQLSEIISSGMTLDEYRENGYKKKSKDVPENTEGDASESDNKNETKPTSSDKAPAKSNSGTASSGTDKPKQPVTNDSSQAECDEKVSQIVAKMYILRSTFTSALAGLAGQAAADYAAGVPKSTIISTYIGQGSGLEAQCDASVNALMSELTGILQKYGRSTELVNTIYATYESEKQYTKAQYMSQYLK